MFSGGVGRLSSRFGLVGAFIGKFPRISILFSLTIAVPAILGYVYRFNINLSLNDGFISKNSPSHREIFVQRNFFGKEENSWLATLKYPVSQVLSYDVNIGKHVFERTYSNRTGELVGAKFLAYYFTVFLDDELRKRQVDEFELAVTNLAEKHNANNNSKVEILTHGSGGVTKEIQRSMTEWVFSLLYGHGAAVLIILLVNWLSGWYSDEQFTWRRVLLAFCSTLFSILAVYSSLGVLLLLGHAVNLMFITSPTLTLIFLINIHGAFSICDSWNRLYGESNRKQFTPSERLAASFEQIALSYLFANGLIFTIFFVSYFVLITNYSVYALFVALASLFNFLYQTFFYSAMLVLLCFPKEKHSEPNKARAFFYAQATDEKPKVKANHLPPIIIKSTQNGADKSLLAKTKLTKFKLPLTEEQLRQQKVRKRRQFRVSLSQKVFYPYSKCLSSRAVQTVVIIVFTLILWCSSQGINRLENHMDYRHILPQNSPSNRAFQLMDTIWSDILQIVYIVERAPDFENATEYANFRNFVKDATSLPHAMPARTHMSWIFDYYRDKLNLEYFADRNLPKRVNMSEFKNFISTFPYKAWEGGVHFVFKNASNPMEKPKIERMIVLVAYNETSGLTGKLRLMKECRNVAARYPQFRIVAFDTDSQTVDIMGAVPITCLIFIIALLISSIVLSVLLLGNILAALLLIFSISAMIVVFYGLGQVLCGLQLDLLTVPATWTILAQILYIGTQFVGNFLQCWAKEDQQRRALEFTSSALWKTTIAWIILVLPQIFSSAAPLFALQAKLQLLGLFITTTFAMLYLPAQIAVLSQCFGTRTFQ